MAKRICAILMSMIMVISLLQSGITAKAEKSLPRVSVSVTNKLDVALAVGNTQVDYSEFAEDLRKALKEKGVSEEDIFISELKAETVGTTDSSFNWWTYDHSYQNGKISDEEHQYIEITDPANDQGYGNPASSHPFYRENRHIVVGNSGADLTFNGYGMSAYKDFMYLENKNPTKKTFEFDIEELVAYDALDGVGFFFNTSITGSYANNTQIISGYLLFLQYGYSGTGEQMRLYQVSNVKTKDFHHTMTGATIDTIPGFTELASASYSAVHKFRKLKVEAGTKRVKVWYKGSISTINEKLTDTDIVSWTIKNTTSDPKTEVAIAPTASYGFGPIGSYRNHSCNRPTSIALKNLTMSTESPKTLTEVVRQPEWQKDSKKFIVNLNDDIIDDFNDPQTTGEIINRLNNDDVYYIGWGSNENEGQTEKFLVLNNLKGTFINNDDEGNYDYQDQINKIADSVVKRYSSEEVTGDVAHIQPTDSVRLTVSDGQATGTADEEWPNGKWRVDHDTEGFGNVEDSYLDNGQYVSDLDVTFEIPGTYKIYYENQLVKTIVSNRKPVALFDTQITGVSGSTIVADGNSVSGSAITVSGSAITVSGSAITVSGAAITYIDHSYDPDDINGIDMDKHVWRYINLSDDLPKWVESNTPIEFINEGDSFLVSLVVTDRYGAVSIPFTKQLTYTEGETTLLPFADFDISISQLFIGSSGAVGDSKVSIINKSYDFYDGELTYAFTITKDGKPYEKDVDLGTNTIDFSGAEEGTYKINLTVTSGDRESKIFTKTITIIKDDTAPTVSSSVPDNTSTGSSKVVLTFEDLGKSGLKEQKVIITNSVTTPVNDDSGWTKASNSQKRNVFLTDDGANYIHYKATDHAGNEIIGFVGPIHYEANIPFVTNNINPNHASKDQLVNTILTFQMSEQVVKGDGYLTIYNKGNGKKYLEIHSSNNRVKISDTGLVTVELPRALEYNTDYYVVVGDNFVKDLSGKKMASFGNEDEWTFKTIASAGIISDEDIKITKVEVSGTDETEEMEAVVNVDKEQTKTYIVYVKGGEFNLTTYFNHFPHILNINSEDCAAELLTDGKTITVTVGDDSTEPVVTLTIGENNQYTFKIVKTDKEFIANTEVHTTNGLAAAAEKKDLLNAVDITEDVKDETVKSIFSKLTISEPQGTKGEETREALEQYIRDNIINDKAIFFETSLSKTVTYKDDSKEDSIIEIDPAQEPVRIIVDIPKEYQNEYSYQIFRYDTDGITKIPVSVINESTQLSFEAERSSTYGITYTKLPEADFDISTSILYEGSSRSIVTISNLSSDSHGKELTPTFTITKDGKPYVKEIKFGDNDFTMEEAGEYIISLTVTNEERESKTFTKNIVILKDEKAPTLNSSVKDDTTTDISKVVLTFDDAEMSGLKEQKVIVTSSSVRPDDDDLGWTKGSNLAERNVYLTKDGSYYIHYIAIDYVGNETIGRIGPIHYEANAPFVTNIISPVKGSKDQPVNTILTFQMSEKVVKGDGYFTIYSKGNDKKYIEIHSSNNRVKISATGLVTVELPKALEYNTEYYVVVSDNFVKDKSGKSMDAFGNAGEWSFKTILSKGSVSDEDIKIGKVEISLENENSNYLPVVNVNKKDPNHYFIFVTDGTFTLTPHFSHVPEKLSVSADNSTAALSKDKKSIVVTFADNAQKPVVRLTLGDNNIYVFEIIQTNKKITANIEVTASNIKAAVGNKDLLNAVDILEDVENKDVEGIYVELLIREPQSIKEQQDLETFLGENLNRKAVIFFDAALLKTIVTNTDSTTTSIANTQEPISIIIDIPVQYQNGYSYQIFRNHNGVIVSLPVAVIQNGIKLSFETDRFSTYGITYTKLPESDNTTEETTVAEVSKEEAKPIIIPKKVTATAGNLSTIEISNLPKDAEVTYHVNTPTLLSLDENGQIFAKKSGKGEVYVRVITSEKTYVSLVSIDIKKSSETSTKVGFIKYYEDIVSYKDINYRITKEAVNGQIGTAAVTNNQINGKLPSEVVIPAKIKINGKSYYVTSIDESAFYNVKTITKVTISKTVKEISATAFTGCKVLKTFDIAKDNTNYSTKKSMLLDKSGEKLIAYPSAAGKITIDKNIKVIGEYAFSVCRDLTQVLIPNTVKVIEGCAFAHSEALISITFAGNEIPEIPYLCIFDAINKKAVITVPSSSLKKYQDEFKDALLPKGVKVKGNK